MSTQSRKKSRGAPAPKPSALVPPDLAAALPDPAALMINRVELGTIAIDAENARKHDERNLDDLCASLKKFGQVEPLVVRAGTRRLIGGEGRLQAMHRLGWTHADIVELDIDDVTARALGIALNQTALSATWDETVLAEQLRALQSEDFDIEAAGYTDGEVDELLARLGTEAIGDAGAEDEKKDHAVRQHTCPECGHKWPC